ncbi:glycoside hydrolase family 38 C-terminal domain-containing protein [Rugosimonospora acidiphila]|uniref:Glycoside hydrolase family 38 C-terminal domain-containing protein n=1 Tax=Rugosimonospora acidiphila TaxID=556531 RepID=A0ABP9RTG7_9ACTN
MLQGHQKSRTRQIEDRVDRFVAGKLRPRLYRARVALDVTHRVVGGEPVPFEVGTTGELAPLPVGSAWGRAWDTVWMRLHGVVPAEWARDGALRAGTSLEAIVDLGFSQAQPGFQAEGLAFSLDGAPVKGISPLNHHVPFDRNAGEAIDFWVEAAANPNVAGGDCVTFAPTPLGSWETAGEEPIYRLRAADLALLDLEVYELVQDTAVLLGLMRELPDTEPRRWRIARALERMIETVDPDDVSGTAAAGRAVLRPELAKRAHASAHRIHATGHAHIDTAWLWPLRETVRKCARTFSNVLDLMDRDPDFVFSCSSAQQLAWIKRDYPALFERIRQRVAEGRFIPVGGMWVESDTNMPSGESLVRQFTFGQRFFEAEFEVRCEEVWLPDSFGYTGALPQIARGAGAQWFFTQKLSWNRVNAMPHNTFRWEGHDGSSLFTHMAPIETYNSRLVPEELRWAEQRFADHLTHTSSLAPFGWGDGGGGPTREMVSAARRSADLEGVPRVELSSPARFFREAQAEADPAELAVWKGEMYLELHRGTYTSQARTKHGNRTSESLLREAELWAATASVRTGAAYPAELLADAWRRVLLLQFHDILPGSAISWVHREAVRMHEEIAATLRELIATAQSTLAGTGDRMVRFNASPLSREGVPALAAAAGAAPQGQPVTTRVVDGTTTVENDRVRLVVDERGLIIGLRDLRDGRDLLTAARPGNLLQLHRDLPAEWDAWDLDEHYRNTTEDLDGPTEVELVEAGGAAARLVVRRRFHGSTVEQRIILTRGSEAIRIETDVDWHEREKVLKLAFPLRLDAVASTAETQFGHLTRPTTTNTSWDEAKFEICAHRWLHVAEGGYGVAVANATVYGHDVVRGRDADGALTIVRETLLRGPLYPDPETDQGRHSFVTVLAVGADIARAVELGYDLAFPVREIEGHRDVEPLVALDGAGVLIDTIKLADDGSGDVVVRLYESLGQRASVRAYPRFAFEEIVRTNLLEEPEADVPRWGAEEESCALTLRPFELVTLRIRRSADPAAATSPRP